MGMRTFINSPGGRTAATLGAALGLAILISRSIALFGPSEAGATSANRVFICAETNRAFTHALQPGDTIPVPSPHGGKPTGYPAELCNWTTEGAVSDKTTPVLLNRHRGLEEPTFCPECGRLVVELNPLAARGRKPPPRREEYRPGMRPRMD